jgi:hypothetical protein
MIPKCLQSLPRYRPKEVEEGCREGRAARISYGWIGRKVGVCRGATGS